MRQLWFDALGPFVRDSDTSRAAAIDNYPRSGTQRRKVMDAIADAEDGCTRAELVALLNLPVNSVCPRVCELLAQELIVETSETRTTPNGSQAHVLRMNLAHGPLRNRTGIHTPGSGDSAHSSHDSVPSSPRVHMQARPTDSRCAHSVCMGGF